VETAAAYLQSLLDSFHLFSRLRDFLLTRAAIPTSLITSFSFWKNYVSQLVNCDGTEAFLLNWTHLAFAIWIVVVCVRTHEKLQCCNHDLMLHKSEASLNNNRQWKSNRFMIYLCCLWHTSRADYVDRFMIIPNVFFIQFNHHILKIDNNVVRLNSNAEK